MVRLGFDEEAGDRVDETIRPAAHDEGPEEEQLGDIEAAAASNAESNTSADHAWDACGVVDIHTSFAGIVADTEAS